MPNTTHHSAPPGALTALPTLKESQWWAVFSLFMQEIPFKPKMNDEKPYQNSRICNPSIDR